MGIERLNLLNYFPVVGTFLVYEGAAKFYKAYHSNNLMHKRELIKDGRGELLAGVYGFSFCYISHRYNFNLTVNHLPTSWQPFVLKWVKLNLIGFMCLSAKSSIEDLTSALEINETRKKYEYLKKATKKMLASAICFYTLYLREH